jgi:antitoxin YefM
MRTATYTDLRNNLKSYLDGVVNDCEPLIIHRPANTSVVVISLAEYNATKETEYLAASPKMMQRIKDAENEIRNGEGKIVNIDDLWN